MADKITRMPPSMRMRLRVGGWSARFQRAPQPSPNKAESCMCVDIARRMILTPPALEILRRFSLQMAKFHSALHPLACTSPSCPWLAMARKICTIPPCAAILMRFSSFIARLLSELHALACNRACTRCLLMVVNTARMASCAVIAPKQAMFRAMYVIMLQVLTMISALSPYLTNNPMSAGIPPAEANSSLNRSASSVHFSSRVNTFKMFSMGDCWSRTQLYKYRTDFSIRFPTLATSGSLD
mmetsp:Transcript_10724/g.25750  ORF Transcript_10724/g.25750 Transcript_10724/m.25750 type:complete len:241 (+) Transcript_10724:560-1282(+)